MGEPSRRPPFPRPNIKVCFCGFRDFEKTPEHLSLDSPRFDNFKCICGASETSGKF